MGQDTTGKIGRKIQTHGTRVMELHSSGLSYDEIGLSLSIESRTVWAIVAHFTGGPGPDDPTPEEIATEAWRIRCGDVRVHARRGTGARLVSTGERTIQAKPSTVRREP